MEVEEKLTLEQKRCESLIKTRVAVLEDKYLKSKTKEGDLNKKLKDVQMQKDSNEKEIRMLRDKAKETQNEISKLQSVWTSKVKSAEDDGKIQVSLERKRLEDLLS